ncbi:hypothetical protein [Pseudomonas aeruginosa]|uniref:hypothetical protein n=2 Tax=Pseudomonas aeruginosa TaxID=287 RepID=UPI0021E150EC|nr:hypothetical protein [Pseudomonas aeruginosa]
MFAGMIHKPWSAPPATIRTPRRPKDGLNNGLKSRGLEWISVDIIGSSQKKKLFLFNGLKRSVDVLGNPWIDGVERAKGIEPSKTAFQSVSMRSIACVLVVPVSEFVPFRFVDFDTFSTA